jgi:hypothetical protein
MLQSRPKHSVPVRLWRPPSLVVRRAFRFTPLAVSGSDLLPTLPRSLRSGRPHLPQPASTPVTISGSRAL